MHSRWADAGAKRTDGCALESVGQSRRHTQFGSSQPGAIFCPSPAFPVFTNQPAPPPAPWLQASAAMAASMLSPGCPRPWLFWVRELNLLFAPWGALTALAMPLPFWNAAMAYGAYMALNLAACSSRRQLSRALCALSEQHYAWALQAVTGRVRQAAAPPTAAHSAAGLQHLSPAVDPFTLLHALLHLLTACFVLGTIHRFEQQEYKAFVQPGSLAGSRPRPARQLGPRVPRSARSQPQGWCLYALATCVCVLFWAGCLWCLHPR